MTKKRKEAVLDEVASILWRVKSNGISGSGLGSESNARSSGAASAKSANMPASRRMTGREGDSSLSNRRMTAAPLSEAFSIGVVRAHGLIAPVRLFHGSMPCGKPSGLPSPIARSVNPHGVALPVGRWGGFRKFAIGASHE